MELDQLRRQYRLDWLSSVEIASRFSSPCLLFLPVGSTEQHGAHLPTCTDSLCAELGALATAEVLESLSSLKVMVAPPVVFGVAPQHASLPGTVTVSSELLIQLICEVVSSPALQYFRAVFLFNGHGGNGPALSIAARRLTLSTKMLVAVASFMEAVLRSHPLPRDAKLARYLAREASGHGGLVETALVMAADLRLVNLDRADLQPVDAALEIEDAIVSVPYLIQEKSRTGVFGSIVGASAELGNRMLQEGGGTMAWTILRILARKGISVGA